MINLRTSWKKMIWLSAILVLSACNLPTNQTSTPTPDAKMLITEAAMTVAAQLTQSAQLTPSPTVSPTAAATNTPTQAPATVAPPPPGATNTPQPTTAPAVKPDAGSFVADVTIPDGTGFASGDVFDKTWRVKNTGTSTWTTAYSLAWIDGDKMGGGDSVALPKEVKPGETVDITIRLTAPSKAGTFQTYYRLRNAGGQYFKLDGGGDLWVKITVGAQATSTATGEAAAPTATATATETTTP